MPDRPAAKAGTWYPAHPETLREIVTALIAAVPASSVTPGIVAGVVPHAGLMFSGGIAAHLFSALHHSRPVIDTIVFLGAVHTMRLSRPAVWADGNWETPLGAVAVDETLADAIVANCGADAFCEPHYQDNAIELQTPFVRILFPQASIVPVAMPPMTGASGFGKKLAQVLADRNAAVIASTDLTHYGVNYGFMPAGTGEKALAWAKENDRRLLRLAGKMDAESIVPTAECDRSACGAGALAAAVAYARERGVTKGELLAHTTSFEIMPDDVYEMSVGYAAMAFNSAVC